MKRILFFSLLLALSDLPAQVDLTSNLKVCMPMDGNANDFSGNGNNGVVSNATLTTDRFGNTSKAYRFKASVNSNISIRNFIDLAPTNELTISMWAKVDIITSNCLFILDPDNQTDRCVGCAQYLNGSNTMMIWDYGNILSGGRSVIQSIPADTTNWHHYVYVISQSGNIKQTYLDGAMNLNAAYALSCSNKNLPLSIGGGYSNGTTSKIMWTGKIDELYVYNRALTSAEVSALFSGSKGCSGNVGIAELTNIENMLVYPDGFQNGIYIVRSNKLNAASMLEVYATDGKLVKKSQGVLNEAQVDLSEAALGIYLVKLITAEGIYTRKIIKE